jgi:hypothetical protein
VLPLLPSLAGLFIYSLHGKWVFSPLLWGFPAIATFTSFPAPGCWVCATAPAFSSQLVVRDFPSPCLRCSGRPPSLLRVFFCYYCLLFRVFFLFFPWVGVGLSWGLC